MNPDFVVVNSAKKRSINLPNFQTTQINYWNLKTTYHSSHGMHTSPVAGSDEQIGVASHEVLAHADEDSVG